MGSNRFSIQGHILEVTVHSGNRLKNTELISRQDPYVVLKYGGTQCRTKTCKDGGRNPVFPHDKFQLKLIEGLRKIRVIVYNSNTFSTDDLIGSGNVDLEEVLCSGFQEYDCLLTNETRAAGVIRLILRYPNAQKQETTAYVPYPPSREPAYCHTPDPYPPCPPYQPQYPRPQQPQYPPPPQQHYPIYPPQNNYPHTHVHPPPPSAPPIYPPPAYSPYPPPPGPSYVYPPSPHHGCNPPQWYN